MFPPSSEPQLHPTDVKALGQYCTIADCDVWTLSKDAEKLVEGDEPLRVCVRTLNHEFQSFSFSSTWDFRKSASYCKSELSRATTVSISANRGKSMSSSRALDSANRGEEHVIHEKLEDCGKESLGISEEQNGKWSICRGTLVVVNRCCLCWLDTNSDPCGMDAQDSIFDSYGIMSCSRGEQRTSKDWSWVF